MPKSSFFNRSKTLAFLASKVAAKEMGLKISDLIRNAKDSEIAKNLTRIQQAKTITENLSQLKGAAMKAGQLMSLDASEFLPPEAISILSELQSMATPEEFAVIEKVLRAELAERMDQLENLSTQPLAAASIGQVHRASYKNQEIVLKVQYPGIEESIDSDLELLKKITQLFLLQTNKRIDLTETFSELSQVLHLEADYEHELAVLSEVYQKLIGNDFFSAPKPLPEMSSKKVIAMQYCPGTTLHQWIQNTPSPSDRQQLGERILELFNVEFLEWNLVQTDPNFGNYLVQTDPLRVVLLDFGSSLRYSKEFIANYLETLHIASQGDPEKTFDQAVKFELLDSREPQEVENTFQRMMVMSMHPFLSSQQPFNFSSIDYEKESREAILAFSRSLRFSPPPRKVLFLHRKLGGLFNLLKRMDVRIDLRPHWAQLMKTRQELA